MTIYYQTDTSCNCTYTPSSGTCSPPYSPYNPCPPVPPTDSNCLLGFQSCNPILTYRVVAVSGNILTLDRSVPNYQSMGAVGNARVLFYPSGMTGFYDSATPEPHWNQDVLNFQSVCDVDLFNVNVWNMNIPWSESPAGVNGSVYQGYDSYNSTSYLGSKEYFAYSNSTGQSDSSSVYYYNSLGTKLRYKVKNKNVSR
jgi:hypothetical protein